MTTMEYDDGETGWLVIVRTPEAGLTDALWVDRRFNLVRPYHCRECGEPYPIWKGRRLERISWDRLQPVAFELSSRTGYCPACADRLAAQARPSGIDIACMEYSARNPGGTHYYNASGTMAEVVEHDADGIPLPSYCGVPQRVAV